MTISGAPNARRGRVWLWISLAIVVTAAIVVVIGQLYAGQDEEPPVTAPPTSSTGTPVPPASTEPSPPDGGGACSEPASEDSAVPDDLEWQGGSGVAWPSSPSLGPTDSEGEFPTCFARSPVGAALAATNMYFLMSVVEPYQVMDFYLVESPGRDQVLEATSGTSADFVAGLQSTGVTVAGFEVVNFEPDHATVELVMATPQSSTGFVGFHLSLVWVDGDWRIYAPDSGQPSSGPVELGTFTEWNP